MADFLNGTWPVPRPTDRFYGTVKVDGQHPRVAGLACYKGELVALSLVGYDTSVSAVLASLWFGDAVPFQVGEGVRWEGPRALKRRTEPNKQLVIPLEGVKEVHGLALPASAHIAEGILHPPDLPAPAKEPAIDQTFASKRLAEATPSSPPKVDRSRFVFGNWDEDSPHERSFLGTLYGMRVLFLHKDETHPAWPQIWARQIWERGSRRSLIQPIREALGVKAWVLSDDLVAWGKLI